MKRLALLLLVLAACRSSPEKPPTLTVLVKAPLSVARQLVHASWSPRAPVLEAERIGTTLALVVDARHAPPRLHLTVPGACPLDVPLTGKHEVDAHLAPWLDAGDERNDAGFDKDVQIELRPGCRAAVAGRITWKQIAGPHIDTRELKNGFVLAAHTLPLSKLHPAPLPWGPVPLSPRTRGAYAFEATWSDGRHSEKQIVRFASAPRARGVTSIATGQRVYLGGKGWTLDTRPAGSRAALVHDGALTSLLGDERGRYVLHDVDHRELALQVGRFDVTPLDCGRSNCHAKQAEAVKSSRMTHAFERVLDGKSGRADPCVLGCHTVGEPGVADGGFAEVARQLGWVFPAKPRGWSALPRALRRLGGVTCNACHGAGSIPERNMRWAMLRPNVCANCHDAPPRYGHVVAWRQSRMARSDAEPRTRQGKCAQCHTTAGFLAAHALRDSKSMPPPDLTLGIACAACHAPHGAHMKTALLRKLPLPDGFAGRVPAAALESSVCLGCHATAKGDSAPASSAGNLVFEVGPVAPEPHPVHALAGGCIACHGRTPESSKELGTGHTFRTRPASCTGCHKDGPPPMENFGKRAGELLAKLEPSAKDGGPPHAADESVPSDQQRAQALAAVRLVLEDPAAGAHNPGYAKRLLDFAETQPKR